MATRTELYNFLMEYKEQNMTNVKKQDVIDFIREITDNTIERLNIKNTKNNNGSNNNDIENVINGFKLYLYQDKKQRPIYIAKKFIRYIDNNINNKKKR